MDPREEKESEIWAWITEAFKRTPEPGSPDFFVEQVMQRVRPEPSRAPARRAWWWVPALTPAALAMALMMAWAGQAPAVSTEALLNAEISQAGDLFVEEP